MGDKHSF